MASIPVSGIALLVGIILLCVLSFRGLHPIIVAIFSVVVLCLINQLDPVSSIFDSYMTGVSGYFKANFLVFLVGTVLGKFYLESGAAESLAIFLGKLFGTKRTLQAVFVMGFLLCFGGINSLVVAFAAYPIALQMFKKANLPNKFIPAIMCGGMWTFAMSMPFAPQIHNIIPMNYFGTSNGAALVPGLLCALAQMILVNVWCEFRVKRAVAKGKHFNWPRNLPAETGEEVQKNLPSPIISVIPMLLVVVCFDFIKWRIEISMLVAILSAIVLFYKYLDGGVNKVISCLGGGTTQAIGAIIATAAIVGFGTVVKTTVFYGFVTEVLAQASFHPYWMTLLVVNVCAAMLGSASGGISLMLETIGENLTAYAAQGYSLEAIHRIVSMGSTGLDTLPWNGTIVTVLDLTDQSYAEGFPDLFICCGLIPLVSCILVLVPVCMIMF